MRWKGEAGPTLNQSPPCSVSGVTALPEHPPLGGCAVFVYVYEQADNYN